MDNPIHHFHRYNPECLSKQIDSLMIDHFQFWCVLKIDEFMPYHHIYMTLQRTALNRRT